MHRGCGERKHCSEGETDQGATALELAIHGVTLHNERRSRLVLFRRLSILFAACGTPGAGHMGRGDALCRRQHPTVISERAEQAKGDGPDAITKGGAAAETTRPYRIIPMA